MTLKRQLQRSQQRAANRLWGRHTRNSEIGFLHGVTFPI